MFSSKIELSKLTLTRCAVYICCCAFFCVANAVAMPATGTRYLVLLADWGKKGIPPDAAEYLAVHPGLRVTTLWPSDVTPSDRAAALIQGGRIEPALLLADEPVLPLVYRTVLSSATPIQFSWPDDVWNIIVRSQEDLETKLPAPPRGLYLRSGAFDSALIPGLKSLGLRWVGYRDPSGGTGALLKNDFLILAVPGDFTGEAPAFAAAMDVSSSPVTVVRFGEHNPLNVVMLENIRLFIKGKNNMVIVTPENLLQKGREALSAVDGAIQTDLSPWLRRPAVLYRISEARKAIEEYKNSGQAELKTLGALRDEIYALYRFDLLARLNENTQPEDEQLFMAHLNNVFMLLKRPVPAVVSGQFDAWPGGGDARGSAQSFVVTLSSTCLSITNGALSVSGGSPVLLSRFTISVTTEAIVYAVELKDNPPDVSPVVDIYIDLNNQRGAGLTNLLKGCNAFMAAQDAWEFAIRFEKGQALLYRSGRFEPSLVKKYPMRKQFFEVAIPRNVLRGNPLGWGYQAVALEPNGSSLKIDDFLCADERLKEKIRVQATVQLPAFRTRPLLTDKSCQ